MMYLFPVSFRYKFSLLCCFLLFFSTIEAQGLLNRVIQRSKDKVEKKVEDMLVEKASEAIAEKMYRSMSDAFDDILLDAQRQDSAYTTDYNDSLSLKYSAMAQTWMSRMNEAADLPEAYFFDTRVDAIVTSGNDDPEDMVLYFSSESPLFAIEQQEGKDKRIILIDGSEDVTVLYQIDKKGQKTAQAIPNMMGLVAAVAEDQEEGHSWAFEKTGESKTIAGYTAEGYTGQSDSYESSFFLTAELDISWKDSFGNMIEKFNPSGYRQHADMMDGFVLESTSKHKNDKSYDSHWLVKEVKKESFEIRNSDYTFGSLSQ